MDININIKRKFTVNGKEYSSVEEMPDDVREIFNKVRSLQANPADGAKPGTVQSRIIFNGMEYKSIDDMPPEARQQFEKIMKVAGTGSAVKVSERAANINVQPEKTATFSAYRPKDFPKSPSIEPSFSLRVMIISVTLIALLLLLYYSFHGR
jgi:hypothetical protein